MGAWIDQMFEAAASAGGVVRRSKDDVEKYGGGQQQLLAEVRRRDFHLVETGEQYVVLCHKGQLIIHC
jgi:hypothetical protein